MDQTVNYGENHLRLEMWSQINCPISSLKTAFHHLQILKECLVHPGYSVQLYKTVFDVQNFPIISQAINIDKDLPVTFKSMALLFPFLSGLLETVTQSSWNF